VWHSPRLGPKDAADLLPSADDKRPIARRTRGGLLVARLLRCYAVALGVGQAQTLAAFALDKRDDVTFTFG
jgi:hypothetical protein